jgi:hypothetical protein
MAFPFTFEETFDDGTLGAFNSQQNSGTSILDFPTYIELSRQGLTPWRGSHCVRLQLNGTATSYLSETDDFVVTAGNGLFVWFTCCITESLSLAASDVIELFVLRSASANEVTFGVRNNAGQYELYIGETGATRTLAITRSNKKWYQIEIDMTLDSGGGNDGTIDWYVDGYQVGAQIDSLDQAAIAAAWYGISETDAPTAAATGTILLGPIIADDARIYPKQRFFEETTWVTRDIHAFIGPCTLDSASLTSTDVNGVLTVYDTDNYTNDAADLNNREPVIYIRNVTANDQSPGFNTPVEFHHGIYCQMTGGNPQAFISIMKPSTVVMSGAQYVDRGKARQ